MRLVIYKQIARAVVRQWSSIRDEVIKGTARTFPGPVMALGFHPAFWDDRRKGAYTFSRQGFLNRSLHFHESVARSGEPPCYREAAGTSSAWLPESLHGQVHCSKCFSLSLARETVAILRVILDKHPPLAVKSPSFPPPAPFLPFPRQKAHPRAAEPAARFQVQLRTGEKGG